jgi:hypothetical protein
VVAFSCNHLESDEVRKAPKAQEDATPPSFKLLSEEEYAELDEEEKNALHWLNSAIGALEAMKNQGADISQYEAMLSIGANEPQWENLLLARIGQENSSMERKQAMLGGCRISSIWDARPYINKILSHVKSCSCTLNVSVSYDADTDEYVLSWQFSGCCPYLHGQHFFIIFPIFSNTFPFYSKKNGKNRKKTEKGGGRFWLFWAYIYEGCPQTAKKLFSTSEQKSNPCEEKPLLVLSNKAFQLIQPTKL